MFPTKRDDLSVSLRCPTLVNAWSPQTALWARYEPLWAAKGFRISGWILVQLDTTSIKAAKTTLRRFQISLVQLYIDFLSTLQFWDPHIFPAFHSDDSLKMGVRENYAKYIQVPPTFGILKQDGLSTFTSRPSSKANGFLNRNRWQKRGTSTISPVQSWNTKCQELLQRRRKLTRCHSQHNSWFQNLGVGKVRCFRTTLQAFSSGIWGASDASSLSFIWAHGPVHTQMAKEWIWRSADSTWCWTRFGASSNDGTVSLYVSLDATNCKPIKCIQLHAKHSAFCFSKQLAKVCQYGTTAVPFKQLTHFSSSTANPLLVLHPRRLGRVHCTWNHPTPQTQIASWVVS